MKKISTTLFLIIFGIICQNKVSAQFTTVSGDNLSMVDVIIKGNLAVGTDVLPNINFNYDNLIFKENNNRVLFDDTSADTSTFGRFDWRFIFNDSFTSGDNYFALENVTSTDFSGTEIIPFKVRGTAPHNSLIVGDFGRIGFGTLDPIQALHLKVFVPTIRLEQTESIPGSNSGQYIWDIAASDNSFTIKDQIFNSSPFAIKAAAETNSIFIGDNRAIGFGTQTPNGLLDIAHPSNLNNHAFLVDTATGNVGINVDDNYTPNGLLDVQTTGGSSVLKIENNGSLVLGASNAGLQLNRLTTIDRETLGTNIGATGIGTLVYDTDDNYTYCFNGTGWVNLVITSGNNTSATGQFATAMGSNTIASDYSSLVMGSYNNQGAIVTDDDNFFSTSNSAFVIGNGTSDSNRSDAFSVMFNGDTTIGNDLTVSGNIVVLSDERLKANIMSLGSTLTKLMLIDGKSYTMKKDGSHKIGVLAQDIQKVFPELVSQVDKNTLGVNYQGLVPVLINAIKEQQNEIERFKIQEKRLERLEYLVSNLN
ncbi:tail fiber domain-containing protein [Flavobacterium sp. W22_SRS_FP1]|uniref:tail fiber domain-containing protein n=1 Tax=Flavobacterium sp. W22_SRS_FP1 TaxID=3240276 RepID=UPI003F902F3B